MKNDLPPSCYNLEGLTINWESILPGLTKDKKPKLAHSLCVYVTNQSNHPSCTATQDQARTALYCKDWSSKLHHSQLSFLTYLLFNCLLIYLSSFVALQNFIHAEFFQAFVFVKGFKYHKFYTYHKSFSGLY